MDNRSSKLERQRDQRIGSLACASKLPNHLRGISYSQFQCAAYVLDRIRDQGCPAIDLPKLIRILRRPEREELQTNFSDAIRESQGRSEVDRMASPAELNSKRKKRLDIPCGSVRCDDRPRIIVPGRLRSTGATQMLRSPCNEASHPVANACGLLSL
jgi:hypothetical protein